MTIADRNLAKIVAPLSDENANYVVCLKEQSILKKALKTLSKSANKRQRNACSNYAPLERTVLHIFAPTAGTRCTISPKLCMVAELVVSIIKGGYYFSIQFIVFPIGGKMLILATE